MMHPSRPFPPYQPTSPNLLGISTREAWKLVGAGIAALPLGALVTMLGGFFIFGLIVGPILIIGGLIAIPVGVLQLIDPTRQSSISPLGRTTIERHAALRAVEYELAHPSTWRAALGDTTLFLSERWMVFAGASKLTIIHRADALWFYRLDRYRKRFGFKTNERTALCILTRRDSAGSPREIPMLPHQTDWLIAAMKPAFPHAYFGYDARWSKIPTPQFAADVDRRTAMAYARLPR